MSNVNTLVICANGGGISVFSVFQEIIVLFTVNTILLFPFIISHISSFPCVLPPCLCRLSLHSDMVIVMFVMVLLFVLLLNSQWKGIAFVR